MVKRTEIQQDFSGAILDQDFSKGAVRMLVEAGRLQPDIKSDVDRDSFERIMHTSLAQRALVYMALFDNIVLLLRNRDSFFGKVDEVAPGVRIKGMHPNSYDRWTGHEPGLIAKTIVIADALRIRDHPHAKLMPVQLADLFSETDIADLALLMDLVGAVLPDDLQESPADIYRVIKSIVGRPELLPIIIDGASGRGRRNRRETELYLRHLMSSVRDHLDDGGTPLNFLQIPDTRQS
jgi:hypothetical protein